MNNSLSVLDGLEVAQVGDQVKKIKMFQAVVNNTLSATSDYGVIPGTQKPTLLKPGAEKILMLLGLSSYYDVVEKIEDWDKGVFSYTVKCKLYKDEKLITEGLGSCNSKEDKYRYRWVYDTDVPPHYDKNTLKKNQYGKYRIDNDEIYSQVNTLLKMAKKRAQIDATLTVASLSEVFTQDMEDLQKFNESERIDNMKASDAEGIKLTFGKHKGKTLEQMMVEAPDYLEWLLKQDRTNADLKNAIKILMDEGLNKAANKAPTPPESMEEDEGAPPWEEN